MHDTDRERPHGRQGVTKTLGHAREVRGDVGVPRTQHDQGQSQAERGTLPQPQHDRPAPQTFNRGVQATEQTAEGQGHHDHNRQALILAARRQPWRGEGADQLNDHRTRQHQTGLGRSQAAPDQDRRQPAEHDVGQGRLQAHVQGHLPGQRIAQQASNAVGNVVRAVFLADLRQPEQRRRQCRNNPETEAQLPALVEVLAQRHGRTRRHRRAQA
ncbi:hypothetical protein D9M73_177030 [compost metagenome]